ncbi:hypothetical protein [Thalassovita aquimarina]|uniref:Uncharacterized protein n=1 Tax=Thalassovita aquimarina TaxID=2785917 RepID=A0ABS5HMB3_9RHOB|nr:hypothetical protein [Thalassovita aquimarina]MBR9650116.1 hypothetical protein [Thalassovita aquimarina]
MDGPLTLIDIYVSLFTVHLVYTSVGVVSAVIVSIVLVQRFPRAPWKAFIISVIALWIWITVLYGGLWLGEALFWAGMGATYTGLVWLPVLAAVQYAMRRYGWGMGKR